MKFLRVLVIAALADGKWPRRSAATSMPQQTCSPWNRESLRRTCTKSLKRS